MTVFFQTIDRSESVRNTPEKLSTSIQEQLATLRAELEKKPVKNIDERKEIQRKIKRLERLNSVMEWKNIDENNQKNIAEVLKGKSADTIKNSDILTLRKKGVDIANLTLVDEKNPEKEIKSSEMTVGESFIVNFGSNVSLRDRTGAGDILPPNIKNITINGVPCERRNTPRPGYYNEKWRYQPVYDGYKITIMALGTTTEEDTKANERQWKRERLEDMILNEDKPLTNIQDDLDLKDGIEEYKNRSERITKSFTRWVDTVRANSFRLSDSWWEGIANSVGLPSDKISNVKVIMSAIGEHESNSNYQAMGQVLPSGSHVWTAAIWRYQVMPKNWVSWSEIYFWEQLEPTAENQDKVAFARMSEYYLKYSQRYGDDEESIFREIAWDWYGRGSAQIAWHPNTWGYQWSVLAIYRRISDANQA